MEYNLKHYAYIGDAIWEVFVREKIIKKTQQLSIMHKTTTKYVCANFQADMINKIYELLNEKESEIQRRARNLKMTINKRSNPQIHSLATSFEVLIGYWYLNDRNRLNEIYSYLEKEIK